MLSVYCEYTVAGESLSTRGSVSDPVNLLQTASRVSGQVFMSFLSLDGRPGCLQTVKNQYDVLWQSVYVYWALRKTVPYHNCVYMTVCVIVY